MTIFNKIAICILAMAIVFLVYMRTNYTTDELCISPSSCEVWASGAELQDFEKLVSLGFELRTEASGKFYRAIMQNPDKEQIAAAKITHNNIIFKGGVSTLELSGKGEICIPSDAKVTDTYTESGMKCVSFIWRGVQYQAACSNGNLIIGTPAISIGY